MNLADIIPDPDAVIALEPDELGLRLLQVLAKWPQHMQQIELATFMNSALGRTGDPASHYPANRRAELQRAIREAWYWLEGSALLIPNPGFQGNHTLRILSRRTERLALDPDPARSFGVRRLAKETLHPRIREDVWSLFHRGK